VVSSAVAEAVASTLVTYVIGTSGSVV
jgi:hypothetical protein